MNKTSLTECRGLMQVLTDNKRRFCKGMQREHQYTWDELRPYEAINDLLQKITQDEYEQILGRGNEKVSTSELNEDQMQALSVLKVAIDNCSRAKVPGYIKKQ